MGPSWAVLGPSRAIWGRLGPSSDRLEASWGRGAILSRLGVVLGHLRPVLGRLGALRSRFATVLGYPGAVLWLFRPVLRPPAPSWAVVGERVRGRLGVVFSLSSAVWKVLGRLRHRPLNHRPLNHPPRHDGDESSPSSSCIFRRCHQCQTIDCISHFYFR